jgi:paraquat-inducible protein B
MSQAPPPAGPRTAARALATRWPGLVWAAPMGARMVVAYLGLNAFVQRGVDVVVTFDTAGGARVGDTQVVYKGVKIGRVTKIVVSRDVRHVDMTLRLDPRTRDALRDGAKFWLIGAEPSLTDLSSLKAVVSGVSIGTAPGAGAPRRHFTGLDAPPPIPPDEPGTYYLLNGDELGSVRVGSGVYYHGQEIGRVTRVQLESSGGFQLTAFVETPFGALVRPDSVFSSTKAIEVRLNSSGIGARLGPGNSALVGGVEVLTPDTASGEPLSPSGASFPFFADASQAESTGGGPEVIYSAVLERDGGALKAGAPITLSGFPIGRVLQRRLVIDPRSAEVRTAVRLTIAPERLGLTDRVSDGQARSPSEWRAVSDHLLSALVRRGYRLELTQTTPLIGPASLELAKGLAAEPSGRLRGDQLPTRDSAGVSGLIDKANAVMGQIDAMPIAAIGRNLRDLTGRLDRLAGSPELADSLKHLHGALANIDAITGDARPEVGPLIRKLNLAADDLQASAKAAHALLSGEGAQQDSSLPGTLTQLNETARTLRALADYLGRHPEALLKGKGAAP